jgi:hypothetical protein
LSRMRTDVDEASSQGYFGRMGPAPGGFYPVPGGVDGAPDPVILRKEFSKRHPKVKFTTPRQNEGPYWRARFVHGPAWVTVEATESRELLACLEMLLDGE